MKHFNFIVILHRNPKDFKFNGWSYEHNSTGGGIIYGSLKRNNSRCKYMEIKRVE